MTIERRLAKRSRVLHRASAVFNGRQSVLDCSVRNWSQSGALIRMSDWIALPPTFDIDLPGRGESMRVRQCWRRGDDVGVAFMSAEESRPPAPIQLDLVRAQRAAAIER